MGIKEAIERINSYEQAIRQYEEHIETVRVMVLKENATLKSGEILVNRFGEKFKICGFPNLGKNIEDEWDILYPCIQLGATGGKARNKKSHRELAQSGVDKGIYTKLQ